MGNVVNMPDSFLRQWQQLEAMLRSTLPDAMGCTQEEVEHICAELRPIVLEHGRPLRTAIKSDDPEAAVQAVENWVKGLVHGFILALVKRELELYRLRGEAP